MSVLEVPRSVSEAAEIVRDLNEIAEMIEADPAAEERLMVLVDASFVLLAWNLQEVGESSLGEFVERQMAEPIRRSWIDWRERTGAVIPRQTIARWLFTPRLPDGDDPEDWQ